MSKQLSEALGQVAADEAERLFGVRPSNLQAATPPTYKLGDLAFSFPFEVAKRAGGVKPRDVATEVAPALAEVDGVAKVEVAGGGFVNVFLDRASFVRDLFVTIRDGVQPGEAPVDGKVVIEHTNINPNKAAHIGHVRNIVLGDTLARCLRGLGQEVEVQNYIDDTGVQVADVVVGMLDIEGLDAEAIRAIPEPFDHYCWDLYARVGKWYEADESRPARRREVLHLMEQGGNDIADIGQLIAQRVVENHLATARRIGASYNLLAWEGDILRLGLWAKTFERLQATPVVVESAEGKNAGCWIMRLEGTKGFEGMEDADKVLVRSNGTATYVAKDIAYQMWKFGLSSIDFHYAPYEGANDNGDLWTTTSDPERASAAGDLGFGKAVRVYNVIDVRQSYLQVVVARSLEALGFSSNADNSIHYAYEMVALTPRCIEQLGITLDASDKGRPYVEMSGRKGLGIKADDLLDRLTSLAHREVASRHPDRPDAEVRDISEALALGALRYFMLKYGRNKVVAFDFEEALKFQGETGPYLQNSLVRCRAIFRRLHDDDGLTADDLRRRDPERDLADLSEVESEDPAWDLAVHLARLDDALTAAIANLELSILAKWAFTTAQCFMKYYELYRIRGEASEDRRRERAAFVWMYHERMCFALDLMGIPVPDRM